VKVLIREEIAPAGVELLRARFDVDVDSESSLEEIIGGYDAIVVRSATKLTADLIGRAERLKVIGRAGVGVDNVDVEAATRRGIIVANAPESTVVSAAEHTVGLLVALARNIPQAHAALKQGRWERSAYAGVELGGKTLGVLGFGRIGQQVARRALGLGMRVVAFDPYVAADRFRELGAERAETPHEIYAAADFLTLHLPLDAETRGSLDADAFAAMRDGVHVVNIARGRLVDQDALRAALDSGRVARASLDTVDPEPLPAGHWMYSHPAVFLTPHSSWASRALLEAPVGIFCENLARFLAGEPLEHVVDVAEGY
jgi:D-3-phosphoglycerate dehydrogenase